jgi:hypothetical protein
MNDLARTLRQHISPRVFGQGEHAGENRILPLCQSSSLYSMAGAPNASGVVDENIDGPKMVYHLFN